MPTALPTGPHARRSVAALAAAGVLAVVLVGCTGTPAPSPTPAPSTSAAAPIFASDEEALAAAEEAYQMFEAVSHQIATDGGEGPQRVESIATSRFLPHLLDEFDQYREHGLRIEGESSVDSIRLAEHTEGPDGAHVSIYLCQDVSSVRVLDAAGTDVTPTDRPNRTPLIAFLIAASPENQLLVDNVELWSGDDFC
jgi:hypothetical protein